MLFNWKHLLLRDLVLVRPIFISLNLWNSSPANSSVNNGPTSSVMGFILYLSPFYLSCLLEKRDLVHACLEFPVHEILPFFCIFIVLWCYWNRLIFQNGHPCSLINIICHILDGQYSLVLTSWDSVILFTFDFCFLFYPCIIVCSLIFSCTAYTLWIHVLYKLCKDEAPSILFSFIVFFKKIKILFILYQSCSLFFDSLLVK